MTGWVRSQATRQRVWQVETAVTGVLGAMVAERLIRAAYASIRRREPSTVFDSDSAQFSWPTAVLWALAGGLGLGLAKVVSNRLATVGWRIATGAPPPASTEGATAA